jgi:hypothetical protein
MALQQRAEFWPDVRPRTLSPAYAAAATSADMLDSSAVAAPPVMAAPAQREVPEAWVPLLVRARRIPSHWVAIGTVAGMVVAFVMFGTNRIFTGSPAARDLTGEVTGAAVPSQTTVVATRTAAQDGRAAAKADAPMPAAAPVTTVAPRESISAQVPRRINQATTAPSAAPGAASARAMSNATPPGKVASASARADAARAPGSVRDASADTPGQLMLGINPWGEVYVDGSLRGVTPPLGQLSLAPGTHEVEIRNGVSSPLRRTLVIHAGEAVSVYHQF